MGARNGFIVVMGKEQSSVQVMVRFPENPWESTRTALENSSTLAVALETEKVDDKQLTNASVWRGAVVWNFECSAGKPKPEKVAAVANALVEAIKGTVPDFQGKCEECRSVSVNEILLMNRIPVYYCAGCRSKVQAEGDQAARDHKPIEPNLFRGILYGGAAAVFGAVAWGGVAYASGGIVSDLTYLAAPMGYLVGWEVMKGAGRINLPTKAAMVVLTVLSVVMGDVLFYTLSLMRSENVGVSAELAGRILANFWAIATESAGRKLPLFFALLGMWFSWIFSPVIPAHPPEKVTFTSLAPVDQAESAGMS